MKHFILYLFLILLLMSCTKQVGRMPFGDYPQEVGEIIQQNCATSGCHNAESYPSAGNLNLEKWETMFAGSNSGSPVIPYSSKFSSLVYYINTYPDLGPQNRPTMPLNKRPLSHENVKRIKDWIDAGAPDINGNVKWQDNTGAKKLYAVNQGCDVVTVFDAAKKLPVRFIDVGTRSGSDTPHQVRVSPDGKFWYVIFINNNVMQKFRCSDNEYLGEIPLTPVAAGISSDPDEDAGDWNTFVITNDGKHAYCVSWTQNGKISLVDLENRKLIKFVGGQHFPHGITIDPANEHIYVAAQTGNFITKWSANLENSENISLDGEVKYSSSLDPHDLLFTPDGKGIMITCQGTNDVRLLDVVSKTVTKIIPTGEYPQEIVYASKTNQYFVSCPSLNTGKAKPGIVTRISAGFQPGNIVCGFQPHGVAVDEQNSVLYVLSRNISEGGPTPHHTGVCNGRNGFVNFIDLNTLEVLDKKYELSVDPYFIFAQP